MEKRYSAGQLLPGFADETLEVGFLQKSMWMRMPSTVILAAERTQSPKGSQFPTRKANCLGGELLVSYV